VSNTPPAEEPDSPPRHRKRGTEAARDFATARHANTGFLDFVIQTALSHDYVVHVAKRALDGVELDRNLTPESLGTTSPGSYLIGLTQRRQEMVEMLLSRSVDNYLRYVVDVVRAILKTQPNILRSKQHTLTLDEILSHRSIEELIHVII
jgi:hypothetical protein